MTLHELQSAFDTEGAHLTAARLRRHAGAIDLWTGRAAWLAILLAVELMLLPAIAGLVK